jgi:class 3 adenylate cyclase/tetratricopeptide (TPR) repeat protein
MMLCQRCHSDNISTANFCANCGFRMRSTGQAAPAGNGPPDDEIFLEIAGKDHAAEAERKLITALIVDIKDSVALISTLDPEHAHRIVHSVLGIMVDSVVKFDGHVLQPTGDGIYAVFGAPLASQDHAQRAVYAALELQRRLRTYAEAEAQRVGAPLIEVRAGIESGEVVLRQLDTGQGTTYITVGQTVNLAARLQSVAPPGSVVVGEQTRGLVEGYFNLNALPPAMVKGVLHPIAVHEVIGLGRLRRHSQIAVRRELSKFVGRDAELLRLRRALDRAAAGHGQVVSIVTGPGMGKSRLLLEFSRNLPLDSEIIEAYAVSYARKIPWFPIIAMLQDYFEISDVDIPAARRAKIESALAPLLSGLNEILPFLFGLLGIVEGPDPLRQMDPIVRRDRTIEAITKIFLAKSLNHPVVLIFEDLHWIDDQTKSLLDRLAVSIDDARILVLASFRPEYTPNWRDEVDVTEIVLEPLSRGKSHDLLSALMGEDSDLSDLKRQISDRTAGNPFFIEEMVNALFEDGTLTRNATIHLTKPLAELNVPMTVRGVLLERIDQTEPRQKELLQILSIIGQTLPLNLVFEVSPWRRSVTAQLVRDLQAAGFIYVQSDAYYGDNRTEYSFKHALTQEVAYQTILGDRRRQLHKHVAQMIESIYRNFLDDQIAILAHHYSAAGDHPKAIEYLVKAGQQAIRRSAHADAIGSFREALRLVGLVPEGTVHPAELAKLWLNLGVSLLVTKGYAHEEVRLAYNRARELSIAAGDQVSLAKVLRGSSQIHCTRADYESALQCGRDLLALGSQDESYLIEGYLVLGVTSIYVGDYQGSESFFIKALSLSIKRPATAEFEYVGHTGTLCRSYYAVCLTYLGKIDRSLSESLAAVEEAEGLSVPITTAQALAARGSILQRLRYYSAAVACYDRAIGLAKIHGLPYWASFCSTLKAAIVPEDEDLAAAFDEFERNRLDYQSAGGRVLASWFHYLRAELLAKAGRVADAIQCLDDTMAFIAETGEKSVEADVHRLKGTLLLQRRKNAPVPPADEVEAFFLHGLRISRQHHAKMSELRCATGLACLLAQQGRFGEGHDLLGSVYDSFTEGFDAPDLIDARRLIDYLAGAGLGAYPSSDVAGSALLPQNGAVVHKVVTCR